MRECVGHRLRSPSGLVVFEAPLRDCRSLAFFELLTRTDPAIILVFVAFFWSTLAKVWCALEQDENGTQLTALDQAVTQGQDDDVERDDA